MLKPWMLLAGGEDPRTLVSPIKLLGCDKKCSNFLKGQLRPLYVYIFLFKQNFSDKTVALSGIQTWIVRVEDVHADHHPGHHRRFHKFYLWIPRTDVDVVRAVPVDCIHVLDFNLWKSLTEPNKQILLCSSEIMHSDWLNIVMWLWTSNQSASFQHSYAIQKIFHRVDVALFTLQRDNIFWLFP